jgi:hypothetical protein
MGPTMQTGAPAGESRARRSVRRDGALGKYVAQGGSRSLAGAHAKEIRTWATARHLLACYCSTRAARVIESLRACIPGVIRSVSPARVIDADAKDRAEDAAQTAYLVNPSPQTKETYIRALFAEAEASLALGRDLAAQDGAQ